MKPPAVAVLLSLGSVPVLAAAGITWVGADDVQRVLDGESVTDVAADVARREFSASARLRILEMETRPMAVDGWGDHVQADDDHVFRHVRVRIENDGRLDLPVHTRHFRAFDDAGHPWRAEWGLMHGFDTPRLAPGEFEVAIVVFEMPDYVPLVRVEWQGDFASANATLDDAPGFDAPGPPAPAAPYDGRQSAAAAPEDEYQSHWEAAPPPSRP